MRAARPVQALTLLALAAVSILPYLNALPNGFTADDQLVLVENPHTTAPINVKRVFLSPYWPVPAAFHYYRPLVILSLGVTRSWFGLDPLIFHLTNVLLHAACVIALYALLYRLFGNREAVVAACLLFALHPVHTEAVSSIVGRADLLATLFILLTLLSHVRHRQAERLRGLPWVGLASAFFFLALSAKEMAGVLLILALGVDFILWRSGAKVIRGRFPLVYIGYACAAGAYLFLRERALGGLLRFDPSAAGLLITAPWWVRLLTGGRILLTYLRLLIWPHPLSADYSFNQIPISDSVSDPVAVAGVLTGILIVLAGYAAARSRRGDVFFAWLVFAAGYGPVSNVFVPIGMLVAERTLYLPSIGWCFLLALLAVRLAGAERIRNWRPAIGAAVFLLSMVYGGLTLRRNRDWRDNRALYASAVKACPRSAAARAYLGQTYFEAGDLERAVEEYHRALEIDPESPLALTNLGAALITQRRYAEAERSLLAALKRAPRGADAHINLGVVAGALNRPEQAAYHFETALRSWPGNYTAMKNLGRTSIVLGDLTRARDLLTRCLAMRPEDPVVPQDLAFVHAQLGEFAAAEGMLRGLLDSHPRHPGFLNNLSWVLFRQGRIGDALEYCRSSLEQDPKNISALYNLGLYLLASGAEAEAREAYGRALDVDGARGWGRFESAISDLEQMKQEFSDPSAADRMLSVLRSQRGRGPDS